MSQQKPDDVIEVEIELDELDLTSAESKATYAETARQPQCPEEKGARGPVDLCSAPTGAAAKTAKQPAMPAG